MNIFLLDRNLKVCDSLSSEGSTKVSPFFNDEYIQRLETGAETFEFESFQHEYLVNGNYVAFMYKNEYKLFQISEVVDTHESNKIISKVYCEFAGLELSYEVLRPRLISSANIKQFLQIVLADTSWEVGYVDESINGVFTIDITNYDKIYDIIQEHIKTYDCEISFRVDIKNGRVTHKYVDAFHRRGSVTNQRFEYSRNLNGVTRTVNSFDLVTGLIGLGKNNMTFKDAEWSTENGNPINKPLNQDYIVDENAYKLYNNNGSHLMGYFKCDLESPYDILQATYKELQERNKPKIEYEVDVAIFDLDEVELGDEIYIIDNDWYPEQLHLGARINELKISFANNSEKSCKMANFKEVKSKISDELSNILNMIPNNTEFMGISKGGLLSSNIEAEGFNIKVENKLVNKDGKEYYVRLKDKEYVGFMNDILPHDSRYITQSFAMDFDDGCIYTSQVVTETNPEHILISKIRISDKKVLGYMRLHGFGHGSQIGIDKLDGVVKIWCECYGEPHATTGKLFGTKICRFAFENGKEYTTSAGNVFDMVADARNIQVSISEQTNRLSVKYITYSNKNAINVYDLKSIIDNNPRMLGSFTIPSWLETSISPNQGHSVYGNRVYHYQGGDSAVNESEARVTVFDFMGNVLDSNIILDDIKFSVKEPEGMFVREKNGIYELYAGMSEGAWPNRKYHIYKFIDSLDADFEKRGSFIHNNGYKSTIEDVIISTGFNGSNRRKAYLLFTDRVSNKFVIASFKNGKWWINAEEYTPNINDSIIAELIETNDRVDISLLTNDFESVKGEDGEDSYSILLTNENHTIPCENNGDVIYSELEKAKSEICVYKGTKEVDFTLTKVDLGCTSIYNVADRTISITSLTDKSATVTLSIKADNTDFTKVISISKAIKGDSGAGVNIIGSLNSESDLPNFGNKGDAYIIGGFLYVWRENTNTWENVGQIKGDQGIAGEPGVDGITYYTWIKYADDENGSGMSDDAVDSNGIYKKYMGMAYNKETQQESNNPNDYTWIKVIGEDGHDSIIANLTNDTHTVPTDSNGTNGNYSGCSTQIELFIGSEKVTNGVTYSFSPISGITGSGNITNGTYTVTNMTIDVGYVDLTARYNNKNFVKRFTISKNKQGRDGTDGTNGIDGRPGADGKIYYTWIKYSNNADGNPMTDNPNSKYIGIAYNKPSIVEGNNPQDYTWTLIRGEDGRDGTDGQDGIPGAPGEDGITYYTWIKYSNNADGSNMTDNPDSKYIGIAYNKLEKTESTNPKDYSWTLIKGEDGQDAYTINLTNDNHSFGCDSNGNIETTITTTTSVSAFKGTNPVTATIGSLPTVAGLTLSKSGTTVTIQANTGKLLADNGSFNIPITIDGHSFVKSFSWVKTKSGSKGDKGDAGVDGSDGIDGTSPVLVTISGQQSMKYLDKTTTPIPSTITLTANVMEGNAAISSGLAYIWQYKNSSESWVNLSGAYTGKTYSLSHNNIGFVNDVVQVRVAVSYKSETYYSEHTITKIYDNKYISKEEVFDKITEGGTNQLIYKDPDTGDIYINATYIKTGSFVADLIKGGLLTLGGTGNSDTGDYGRFRILDSTGQNELASMDGGEMRMVNLQAEELNTTDLNVKNINCATYAPAIYEYTKVYVNTSNGNDEVEFESGAIFKTLQGALDSAPKNLNGFTTEIVLQTAVSENIVIRGFSGGTLNILMNSNNINGYIVARDCSAQVFILGGLTTNDIPDGIDNTGLRPNIQPSQLFSFGGYNYSFVSIGCKFVYVRSVDIFGKTGATTNYCVGAVNGSNIYVQNVNAYASNSGYNVQFGGKLTTRETYGRCERLAYNIQTGGVAHICNGSSTGAPTNIYNGNGGQVIQGSVTFIGDSTSIGSNNNTTTNSTSVTLNANSGDSYKVKYSSWRKDNSVRQGDWSNTGMNKGCWFFGNQFADLKGKTIKSVKLTLQRQSGGNSGAVAFTLKMHNHIRRPSGVPSYLSEWSKNISLTVGQSTTITITDSAVLTAIKNGTMKGFGIEVSSTSNSYYGILTPKLKAVVTYS